MKLLLLSLLFVASINLVFTDNIGEDVIHAPGTCVMYGSCGFNGDLENANIRGEMACVVNQPATKITAIRNGPHLDLYKQVCPMLVDPDAQEAQLCCDREQLVTLKRQLGASELLFERCPSCMHNFVSLYCMLTCSPDQSTFVNVTNTYTNEGEPHSGSAEQDVYLTNEFAVGMHSSCKDVVFPQTNDKAISTICNGFSGDQCTPQAMLDYLGATSNGVAPVQMNFYLNATENGTAPSAPADMDYYGMYTPQCNEVPDNNSYTCSCTDCELMCPARVPIQEPAQFLIGNADGIDVIVLIVFLVLVLLFSIYAVVTSLKERKVRNKADRPPLKSTSSTAAMTKWSDSDSAGSSSCFSDDDGVLIDESDISRFERVGKASQDFLRRGFQWWGTFVARHPLWVIFPMIVIVIGLCIGVKFIILTTDPVDLWTAETSRVRQEKTYYDDHFGAFYRTEMVIMKLKPEFDGPGSTYTASTGAKYNFSEIIQTKFILELLDLQNKLRYMKVSYVDDDGETRIGGLNDICFKPLEPDNNNCTITSIANYWQNNPDELLRTKEYYNRRENATYTIDFRDHFVYCVQAPATLIATHPFLQSCMGDYGGPIFPFLAVGGQGEGAPYNEATAFILTFVVNNYPKGDSRTLLAKAWEKSFLQILESWDSEYFDYAYFSERSPEEELERSSETDIIVFIASYVVIFVYITIALGTYTSFKRIPVDSKVSLGLAGILVILASVFTSIGFLGYIGYSTSLIVIEVVPFLVLAIGADNIFILTLEYQRTERKPDETLPEHVGRVFADVAPSMLLCSLTECVTFFLGTLTEMPAIEEFAYAAALAILFDFILQITVFLAVLSLDARRQESNRFDMCCCVKSDGDAKPRKSVLQVIFQNYYAPFLMNDVVRAIVMIGFTALCCWCTILTSNMTIGLDQDLSVPQDSYVLKYFDYMEEYLDVGVPVYFVTKNPYNFANSEASKQICAYAGCEPTSLVEQITYASKNSDYWRIETPAASWYDDYVSWLEPRISSCCRYRIENGTESFCPSTQLDSRCRPCVTGEYTEEDFMKYLPWFLIDNPGLTCNKGGHSAYGNAVNITTNYTASGVDVVESSYFMAYHSVCIKSVDCTENLVKARELASNITATLKAANTDANGNIIGNEEDFTVYPYCLYYVYYEQYLTMVEDTLFLVGICLIPTFVFSFLLLGFDIFSAAVTTVTIVMIVVDTAGLSSIWGVHLNAVSLINLVQAIGLSVEFISHVVHTFAITTEHSRKARVIEAMGSMGPAVFAGVALTNLPGIIVLNWATAQLIQVFFFRMCLIITLLGMAHGLVFLPVFLSYFGPPVNKAVLFEKQQKLKEERLKNGKVNESFKSDDVEFNRKVAHESEKPEKDFADEVEIKEQTKESHFGATRM